MEENKLKEQLLQKDKDTLVELLLQKCLIAKLQNKNLQNLKKRRL